VRFYNDDIGYAVSSSGTFYKRYHHQNRKRRNHLDYCLHNVDGLLGLAVADVSTIYAGGGNNQGVGGFSYIVRSTDGGANWQQVYIGLSNAALRGAWFNSPESGLVCRRFGRITLLPMMEEIRG
jgi:hypothetical protein